MWLITNEDGIDDWYTLYKVLKWTYKIGRYMPFPQKLLSNKAYVKYNTT